MAHDHRMNPVGEPHLNRIKRLIEGRVRPESAVGVGKSVDDAYANPETEKQNRREIGLYFKERHGVSPSMDGLQTGPKYKRRTEEEE